MRPESNQNRVIKAVLEFLCKTIDVSYQILEYPDEIERNISACDALAIVGSRRVAIEHTSIDSVPFQRRDDNRFIKLLGPLKSELAGKLPTTGHYLLAVDMNVIPIGVKWDDVRQRISKWVQKVAPTLEIGSPSTSSRHFVKEMPQGVPLEITLYRQLGRDGQFNIVRAAPEDLENQRIEVIREALVSRGTKVTKYRNIGYKAILILESYDVALANPPDIGQAFIKSMNELDAAKLQDEVYLVLTDAEPYCIYCLKFGDTVFPRASISKEPYVT